VSEQDIDGHGLGGPLWEILAADTNTALGQRASCRLVKPVAAFRVRSRGPGLVTSCPGCREAVLRLAGGPTTARLRPARHRLPAVPTAPGPPASGRPMMGQEAGDTAERSIRAAALGGALMTRFAKTSEPTLLARAIAAFETAAPDEPGREWHLVHLGNALRARYLHDGKVEDLRRAVVAYEEAVAASASDSPDRPELPGSLANGLRLRYQQFGEAADLDRGVELYRHAVDLTGQSSNRPPHGKLCAGPNNGSGTRPTRRSTVPPQRLRPSPRPDRSAAVRRLWATARMHAHPFFWAACGYQGG
jgi:Family of unknown function (DUF6510)